MIDLPWPSLLSVAATLLVAYAVYGLSGFGANLVAMPVLAQLLPLRFAVPMLVVFDLCTGVALFAVHRQRVAWREMLRLVPWLLVGMALGVTLLVQVSERWLLMALGAFVFSYSIWSLLRRVSPDPIDTRWAAPAGLVGGAVTALYGTGGPIYTIYLARRLPDKTVLRATIAGLILGNSLVRLLMFAGSGLYNQPGLLWLGLAMLPVVLAGQWVGSQFHHRVSPHRAMQVVWVLLIAGGAALVWRGWHVS